MLDAPILAAATARRYTSAMSHPARIAYALLAALPMVAAAASFDCARASSPAEKLICSDVEASRLDEELAAVYWKALSDAADPAALRREQRQWLKARDACTVAKCLHAAYGDRIAALKKATLAAPAPPYGSEHALASVRKTCLPPYAERVGAIYKECVVRSVEAIGKTAGTVWHAAAYCLAPRSEKESSCAGANPPNPWLNVTAVLIFSQERPDGPLKYVLKLEDDEGNAFHGARIHNNEYGSILDATFSVPGTGNLNASQFLLYRNGVWQPIDFASWQKDLHARLPKGLGVWKGPWPDLGKMVFTSPLWQSKDGNCCPTGGSVHATLGLEGSKLVLRSLKVDRKPLKD